MNTLLLAMLALYDITPDDALAVIDQRPNRAQRRAATSSRRARIKEAQLKWSGLAAEAHEKRIERNAARRNGGAK